METLHIATTTWYHSSINYKSMNSVVSTVQPPNKQCLKNIFSVLHSLEQRNMGPAPIQSFALPAMLLFSMIIIPQLALGGITRHYHFDVNLKMDLISSPKPAYLFEKEKKKRFYCTFF